VEAHTRRFREARSAHHRLRALTAANTADAWRLAHEPLHEVALGPEAEDGLDYLREASACDCLGCVKFRRFRGLAAWHDARAVGQLVRFERVSACGTEYVLSSTCDGCGEVTEKPVLCGHHRLCIGCRGRRARRYRARIARGIDANTRALQRTTASYGAHRYAPKFLTLTVPHSGDVRRDTRMIVKAWQRFWRRVEEYLRLDRNLRARIRWLRVLEFTPGRDLLGHVHVHAVIIAPYISQPIWAWLRAKALPPADRRELPDVKVDELARYWSARTSSAVRFSQRESRHFQDVFRTRRGNKGRALATVPQGIVHIRAIRGGARGAAAEVAKYLTKDAERDPKTGELRYVNPLIYARIYEAAEGRRTMQASRKWWDHEKATPYAWACDCGSSARQICVEHTRANTPPSERPGSRDGPRARAGPPRIYPTDDDSGRIAR
jgi:hypothetical protein